MVGCELGREHTRPPPPPNPTHAHALPPAGQPPSAFPVERMRLDTSGVTMGPRMEAVVEGLLEPLPEDRLGAAQALALLDGKKAPAAAGGRWAPGREGCEGRPNSVRALGLPHRDARLHAHPVPLQGRRGHAGVNELG